MRNVFFLFLLCWGCSTDDPGKSPAGDAGNANPSRDAGNGGGPAVDSGSGGATMTLDGSPPSGGCGDKAPAKCPSPVPSFASDVLPIFEAKCNNCHQGENGPWPLNDYPHIRDWRFQILQDIEGCTMPPLDGGTTLSADERQTVLSWLVCEAPEN